VFRCFMLYKKLLILLICAAVVLSLLLACSSGGGYTMTPDAGKYTERPVIEKDMFSFEKPPAESAVKGIKTTETATKTIDAGGGRIGLSDGSCVVFPAGALDSAGEITLTRLEPAAFFRDDGLNRTVLRCSAPVSRFRSEVEIQMPLPADITEQDSSRIITGILNEDNGVVTCHKSAIKMIDSKPVAVITTNHFSTWMLYVTAKKPPAAILKNIPYYSQGMSPYCWAADLEIVLQTAKYKAGAQVTEVIGNMGVNEGVDESGVKARQVINSNEIANIVSARTGVQPERLLWDGYTSDECLSYIKYEIGVKNRPVAFFSMAWNHAAVIVGYENNRIYLHDTQLGGVPYYYRPWSDFLEMMWSNLQQMATLAIPLDDLDPGRPGVTVNLTNSAFEFTPAEASGDKTVYYRYLWDHTSKSGWSFKEITDKDKAGKALGVLPGKVKLLYPGSSTNGGAGIIIVNSTQDSKDIQLLLEINSSGPGKTHYTLPVPVTLNPQTVNQPYGNQNKVVQVDEFRDNDSKPVVYTMTVSALAGGSTADHASVQFSLDKEEVKIDSLTPERGTAGTAVSIRGSGLGTVRGSPAINNVTFNGTPATEVIAWADNEIQVKVPNGASSGPVIVKRGTVDSNPQNFTVPSGQDTLAGSIDRPPCTALEGINVTFSGTWQVTSKGIELEYQDRDFVDIIVRPNTPVHLEIDGNGMADKKTVQNDSDDGSYDEIEVQAVTANIEPLEEAYRDEYAVDMKKSQGNADYDFTLPDNDARGLGSQDFGVMFVIKYKVKSFTSKGEPVQVLRPDREIRGYDKWWKIRIRTR
jgi:hypothetical protein